MYIYYLLLIIAIGLKFLLNNKKIYFVIMFLAMGVMAGLRGPDVGADTYEYHRIFSQYSDESFLDIMDGYDGVNDTQIELGFHVMIMICSLFSQSPQLFVFVSSCITFFFLGLFIYRNTDEKNYWIAVSLIVGMGYYFYSLAILRQALAAAVAANSMNLSCEKKWISAFGIVFLACMFHNSVAIFFPVLICMLVYDCCCRNSKISKLYFVWLIMVACLLVIAKDVIFNNMDLFSVHYANYLLPTNKHNIESSNGYYGWAKFCLYLAITFWAVYRADRVENRNIKWMLIFSSVCVTMECIVMVLKEQIKILVRLIYNFEMFAWLLIAFMLYKIMSPYIRMYLLVVFMILCYISLMLLGEKANWNSVPYVTFFNF